MISLSPEFMKYAKESGLLDEIEAEARQADIDEKDPAFREKRNKELADAAEEVFSSKYSRNPIQEDKENS